MINRYAEYPVSLCLLLGFPADWQQFVQQLTINEKIEQNILICRWQADQLFVEAEGRGNEVIREPMADEDIFR